MPGPGFPRAAWLRISGVNTPKCKETQQELAGGVGAEAAQVRSGIEEAAHVQGGHHLQVQEQMGPPGLVVSGPDSAVAVHPDVGGAGEREEAPVRVSPLERLPLRRGSC